MSKYILAGEPISAFCKRRGYGCWVVPNRDHAVKLSRMIGARMAGKKVKNLRYHTSPIVWEEKNHAAEVRFLLVVYVPLEEK